MPAVLEVPCPRCGRAQEAARELCALCGQRLLVASLPAGAVDVPAARASGAFRTRAVDDPDARRAAREPWIFLALGLVTAPVFALTPILQYMGWFLASLVHEIGHAAFAWLCGMPAVPAISLAGHAAAVHGEQQLVVVAAVAALSVYGLTRLCEGRARAVAIAVALAAHLSVALTPARELLHLLAGHGAELAFSGLCLWKALDGGFTGSRTERALYGTVGWYLLGRNALLCWGLATSGSARGAYAENGSFGLTNDYLRAADEVLGWRLESVAAAMLVACATVLPLAIGAWRSMIALRRADAARAC